MELRVRLYIIHHRVHIVSIIRSPSLISSLFIWRGVVHVVSTAWYSPEECCIWLVDSYDDGYGGISAYVNWLPNVSVAIETKYCDVSFRGVAKHGAFVGCVACLVYYLLHKIEFPQLMMICFAYFHLTIRLYGCTVCVQFGWLARCLLIFAIGTRATCMRLTIVYSFYLFIISLFAIGNRQTSSCYFVPSTVDGVV